jgi:DNA processing protein
VHGELPAGPAVAIVGTRKPSEEAVWFAAGLASELAERGVVVVSGGAGGIDTAAHRGALQVVGGKTVVVAPAGFRRPFPADNAPLFADVVAAGGAYVALVSDDAHALHGPGFFARNGCLAALAHVLIVVEAQLRSGARNAARYARRLGRPLFAVPWPPWGGRGGGCIEELKLGARPLSSARDVLRLLRELRLYPIAPRTESEAAASTAQIPNLSQACAFGPEAARVIEAVRAGAVLAEELCARTGLSASQIQRLLLTLMLEGVLVADPDGKLRII